ncbi:MAG: riboflavin biosynthesis protein RibF [Ruminococcaceae bacterium]|nr:riboflavin biosynthesis protein RibF [Oscillospiraceae bacterium]HHV30858.1 riboflavin biosynthesis protein RibF [Clostridiales bacterium]
MKIYSKLAPSSGDSAVALGNFDGLHIGHQQVISRAVAEKEHGLIPTVFTFAANPLKDLGGNPGGELITQERKIALLEEMGVEQLYILSFSEIKDLSPEEFVSGVLEGICRAKRVCCGFNFTFGRGGHGNSTMLTELCEARGIAVSVIEAVLSGGETISSTRIRGLISSGAVDEAAKLLGRPYGYVTQVVHGRRLGRELGTPTLNQAISERLVLPRFGVYVSRVFLRGKEYIGVTNIGVKPTVGSPCALAETWMPEYTGPDFYGETVRVDLIKFLRPEICFSGLEELKTAILKDGEDAVHFFCESSKTES